MNGDCVEGLNWYALDGGRHWTLAISSPEVLHRDALFVALFSEYGLAACVLCSCDAFLSWTAGAVTEVIFEVGGL